MDLIAHGDGIPISAVLTPILLGLALLAVLLLLARWALGRRDRAGSVDSGR